MYIEQRHPIYKNAWLGKYIYSVTSEGKFNYLYFNTHEFFFCLRKIKFISQRVYVQKPAVDATMKCMRNLPPKNIRNGRTKL